MDGLLRPHELHAFISQGSQVNPFEQSLSSAEQNRRDCDVPLIDQTRTKILLYCVRSAADLDIHLTGCLARLVKRLVNTACDEMECRAAFHLYGRACVMGEDEDWSVVGWVVPPPALPVHVRPGATNRSKHVPPEDPGTNILGTPRSEIVINPTRAILRSMHLPPRASGNQPVVQGLASDAERIVNALIRTRSVPVNRDGEALNSDACHFHASVCLRSVINWLNTKALKSFKAILHVVERFRRVPLPIRDLARNP
jgi:hypothetical protein